MISCNTNIHLRLVCFSHLTRPFHHSFVTNYIKREWVNSLSWFYFHKKVADFCWTILNTPRCLVEVYKDGTWGQDFLPSLSKTYTECQRLFMRGFWFPSSLYSDPPRCSWLRPSCVRRSMGLRPTPKHSTGYPGFPRPEILLLVLKSNITLYIKKGDLITLKRAVRETWYLQKWVPSALSMTHLLSVFPP